MRKTTKPAARKVATPKRRGSTPADLGNEAAAAEVAMTPKQTAAAAAVTAWAAGDEAPKETNLVLRFKLERETKGAVRFQETRNGSPVEIGNGAVIGALYVRKEALNGALPEWLDVSVSFDRSSSAPKVRLVRYSVEYDRTDESWLIVEHYSDGGEIVRKEKTYATSTLARADATTLAQLHGVELAN